ncbi:unnamed protein product, partial [Ectocarpus sp. 8 AP-2014]
MSFSTASILASVAAMADDGGVAGEMLPLPSPSPCALTSCEIAQSSPKPDEARQYDSTGTGHLLAWCPPAGSRHLESEGFTFVTMPPLGTNAAPNVAQHSSGKVKRIASTCLKRFPAGKGNGGEWNLSLGYGVDFCQGG